MDNNRKLWKKTAAAALTLSLLVGTLPMLASAHSNNGGGSKQEQSWKSKDKQKDNKKDNKKDKQKSNNSNNWNDGKNGSKDSKNNSNRAQGKRNMNFRDLNEDDWQWAYAHIIRLASQGVFNGYEDGSFKPQNKITRIEALVAAVRLLGLQAEAEKAENMNATLNFKDFDKLKAKYGWAVGYVAVALENDLFNEYDTAVQAEKPADRLWVAVLLVKALKLEAEAKTKMDYQLSFGDAGDIPAGAVGYVAVAVEKSLVTGYADGTFRPNKSITRAELAALLDRVGGQLPDDLIDGAFKGTVKSTTASSITISAADGSSLTLTLASDVFVFRNGVKASASALQAGDKVFLRVYDGKVLFIEVTQEVAQSYSLVSTGRLLSFTVDAQNKVTTLSVSKTVNGVQQITIYNVANNAQIKGSQTLAPNQNVTIKGNNNVVQVIEILS